MLRMSYIKTMLYINSVTYKLSYTYKMLKINFEMYTKKCYILTLFNINFLIINFVTEPDSGPCCHGILL
jgi:hypothetical protein